ncbi:uncharacterized protein A1O9_09585 [Exophiala aquamarina CBS 119918]|uniref:Uncharacterized protein n=1 Tax=Exophiala aquamarina CBS 119918 TaxID=1182545 RepID=A0A072P568_9EURO|nr:uncharacterized protein A1O9_09585 [Exophiala aquamarina CBS 119918]KEF54418.1 hypothetical protein A1O9_09585 [Exophiala aquamarina CBS 119918]
MCATLLVAGGISTVKNDFATKVTVALMTLWGFLVSRFQYRPAAHSVGDEIPSSRLRQKPYSISFMSAIVVSTAVLQVVPYLFNPGNANLGGRITFVFFDLSVPVCIYL